MSEGTPVAVLEQPVTFSSRDREKPVVTASWKPGFWSLVVTPFRGAFNNNAYKNLVVFIILGTGLAKADRDRLVLVAGALFNSVHSVLDDFLATGFSYLVELPS